MKLHKVAFHPIDRSLVPGDIKSLPRATRRLMEVILKGTPEANPQTSIKSWSLDNRLSPKHFISRADEPTRVASTAFAVTSLNNPLDPLARVDTTDETTVLPSDVVFRSVGYKSVPLPGFAEVGIQFDESRGVVSNDGFGRVTRLVSDNHADRVGSQQVSGLYCAGWLKRGPTGVIASTMQDAFATGDAIAEDWLSGSTFLQGISPVSEADGWEGVKAEIGDRAGTFVSWDQWRRIDKAEMVRGRGRNKPREKFVNTVDMLNALGTKGQEVP